MSPICLYHRSDLDGKCSGYIVRRRFPEVELLGIEYGDDLDFERLRGRDVYLVDFSLQPWGDMQRLADVASKVIWIDHHKSAIEEFEKSPIKCEGVREVGKAACELCWEYLFPEYPSPRLVDLLGRYDVWDLDASPDVLPFQMGMRLNAWMPEDPAWDELVLNVGTRAIIEHGEAILRYQSQQNDGLMRKAFEHKWRGVRFLAVNAGGINSKAFDSRYDPAEHDAVMGFYFDGKQQQWTVSIYSPDQSRDLSGIAKEMGGGGHAAACGFQIENLTEIGIQAVTA